MSMNSLTRPAVARNSDDSSIGGLEVFAGMFGDVPPRTKDIPKGMLKLQPPGAYINTAPFRFIWGFGLLVILDMAMHAGAGAAAVSVGAKGNGLPVTTQALQLGALAGITKAGITTFGELVRLGHVNFAFRVAMFLLSSSFGICPLLVTEVGNLALGGVPKELLIAAVVAAFPLFFDTIRDIQPKPDNEGKINYWRWAWAIFLIPADALGGYVFARMASNQGMPISSFPAACSAGAVFGTITFLSRAMTGVVAMIERTSGGQRTNLGGMEDFDFIANQKRSTIFGVFEFVTPDPVVISQEEYMKMRNNITGAVGGVFSQGPKMAMKPFKFMASLASCCCPCWFGGLKRHADKVGHDLGNMQVPSEAIQMSAAFMSAGLIGRVVAVGDGFPETAGRVTSASSRESLGEGRV